MSAPMAPRAMIHGALLVESVGFCWVGSPGDVTAPGSPTTVPLLVVLAVAVEVLGVVPVRRTAR